MASFPTSNRTFTAKVDVSDTIYADHINVLQEEVRALSTSLNGEPVVTNILTSTFGGSFSTATTAWTSLSGRLLNIEAGLVNGVPNAPYVRKAGGDTIEPASGTTALILKTAGGTADLFVTRDASNTKRFNVDYQGIPRYGSAALLATTDTGTITALGTVTSGVWNATAITPAYGGTGITSYAIGDLIYATGATTLAKLAGVATGNALISGGVSTAPSWGKIGLTTHVSGTLPTANGGTNLTSFTANGAVYATSTSALTTGTLPTASGGTGLTSFTSGGAMYATSTSVLTTGTLPVTAGGTGSTTSTGTAGSAVVLATSPSIASPTFTGTPVAPTAADNTNTTQVATTAFVFAREQHITIALSDETTSITTGTAKVTWRAPYAMTLTRVPRLSLATAGTSQATIVDINEAGVSVFSTRPQLDANAKTSVGSTVTPVLSDTAIADDAEITFDIDQVGTGAKGLKVTIYFKRA